MAFVDRGVFSHSWDTREVKKYLEYGGDAKQKNCFGMMPIHVSAQENNLSNFFVLIPYCTEEELMFSLGMFSEQHIAASAALMLLASGRLEKRENIDCCIELFSLDKSKGFRAAFEIVWNPDTPNTDLEYLKRFFQASLSGPERQFPLEENETHKLVAAMASLVESDRNNLVLVEEFLKKRGGKAFKKLLKTLNEAEMEKNRNPASFRKTQREFFLTEISGQVKRLDTAMVSATAEMAAYTEDFGEVVL